MKHPRELGDAELARIAGKVKLRLVAQFGSEQVDIFIRKNIKIVEPLLRATYIAVREELET